MGCRYRPPLALDQVLCFVSGEQLKGGEWVNIAEVPGLENSGMAEERLEGV